MRRLAAILVLAVAVIAAACSSTESSSDDASPSPSEAATASPTATASTAADTVEVDKLTGAVEGKAIDAPAKDTVYACSNFAGDGTLAAADAPWTDNATGEVNMAESVRVPGAQSWDSKLDIAVSGSTRKLAGNSLPSHPTGTFPVPEDSEAYQYDRNPSTISETTIDWDLDSGPAAASEVTCLGGGPIGMMLTGAVLYNALDANAIAAVAEHTVDDCEGHAAPSGQYHYHSFSSCFDQGSADAHSPLIGYALDGFGIYGPRDAGGTAITNADLDECHGHTGDAPDQDGKTENVFHYHINNEFPFVPGCYKGDPITTGAPAHGFHDENGNHVVVEADLDHGSSLD